MGKEGSFTVVPGGGIDNAGKPYVKISVFKDGKVWLSTMTTYHSMTLEQFKLFQDATMPWFASKKLTNLSIHELIKLEREGSKMLTDLGEQVANSK